MDSRKIVYRETGIIAIGQGVSLVLMFAVYAIIGKMNGSVVCGGLAGAVLAIANFFFMAVSASVASDKAVNQDVNGGKKLMKSSYILRIGALFLLLFLLVKSGVCDPLASVIPLALVRPTITVAEFFRKSKEETV